MTTAYTPILKLALPVTGELNGTWGDVVNNNITSMVEQAVAGLATINTWAANSHTLTTADGTTSESRCAMLVIDDDGAGNPSAAATVICPTATKAYIVQNLCGQTVTVKTAAGSGVAVPNNQSALVFCNGTDVVTGAFNGDVVGPASATDNAVARYDGTTGKIIQNSAVTIADDGATVIAANSSSDGLRITQVGAGNALLVEDAANPDATPVVIDNSGKLISGSTTSYATHTSVASQIQLHTNVASNFFSSIASANWVSGTQGASFQLSKARSGAIGTQGIVQASDVLGEIHFDGSDGVQFIEAAKISAFVDGTPGTNDMPGRLTFNTTSDGASSPTERMRIDSAGVSTFTGTAIVNANSTTDALRITQLGSGNALLVEDSANPDATPFVIDATGRVVFGNTSALTIGGATPSFQIHSTSSTQEAIVGWGTISSQSPLLGFYRSASGVVGTQGAVASGSDLGAVNFFGDDGTAFIPAAQILAEVDGTPGTNDMPGRLVFSTTADGASSLTERMRIGSAGTVGIGAANIAAATLYLNKTLTGGTTTYGVLQSGQVQSDVTTVNYGYLAQLNTQATAFTLANQRYFTATQGTIGAGSTVTTQAGFFASSNLTGATTNYGFYSELASGTGRWNFYAAGTADNYFAGNVGLGTTTPGAKLAVVGTGYSPNITLSDAATISWDTSTGQVATFTFVSSNRTMGAPTNLVNGGFYALAVIQNAGSNTLTWNAVFKWAGGTAPTLSTAAGAKDYFVFRSDGTSLFQQGISQAVA